MPRRASMLVVCSMLALTGPAVAARAASPGPPCPLVEQASLPYTTDPGDHHQYLADLWRPDDGGVTHPGIVVLHGGGFTGGNRGQMTGESQTLACAGFVVLNADYRVSGFEDDAYVDALAAVAYLRPIVDDAGVGAHGTSAGGYLADRLAVDGRVEAASGFSGGGTYEATFVDRYSTPLYMAHSTGDHRTPASESEAIEAAYDGLTAPGVPHRLDEVAGSAHGAALWSQHPELQQAAVGWFRTYLPTYAPPPPPAPTVTAVSPDSGTTEGGTSVTITGTDFTKVRHVDFGPLDAASFTVVSPTSIVAVSPRANTGSVDVTVTTVSGTTAACAADRFTYQLPSVTSVSPNGGSTAGGTTVTITGSGFTGANAVWFGSLAASAYAVASDTTITATSPAHGEGDVDVRVGNPLGMSAIVPGDRFTYQVPSVGSVSPSSGATAGGTTVTISGKGFLGATAVWFAGAPVLSFSVLSDTKITTVSPTHPPGAVDIRVVNLLGPSPILTDDRFTYRLPSITSVAPGTGPAAGGTAVTITGQYLSAATTVWFGKTAATTFTLTSDTKIVATSPFVHNGGPVDVAVWNHYGTSATVPGDVFTYAAPPPPAVTGLSPAGGPSDGGTAVRITGTNFTDVEAVAFGIVPATSFTVLSPTAISAVSPAHTTGTFDVTVLTAAGTSATSSADRFTYTSDRV